MLSVFIHGCINCQVHKYKKMKQNKFAIFPFSKLSTFFIHSMSMNTEGPINPTSEGNHYLYVIVDHFSIYNLTVPTPKNVAQYAIKSKFHHWISTFGPPQCLRGDRGTEYLISEMANCCTLYNFRHSPKIPNAPWTNGFVQVQNKNFGTHLKCFYKILLKICLSEHIALPMLILLNHSYTCIIHQMK